jgi:hypothetical protein
MGIDPPAVVRLQAIVKLQSAVNVEFTALF